MGTIKNIIHISIDFFNMHKGFIVWIFSIILLSLLFYNFNVFH